MGSPCGRDADPALRGHRPSALTRKYNSHPRRRISSTGRMWRELRLIELSGQSSFKGGRIRAD
jgi:hypothetical protein